MIKLGKESKKHYGFTPLSNVSQVDLWIISRLKKENSVPLTILADQYAKERKISKRSARKVLERHLKALIQEGIVERLDTHPFLYKLKRLPPQFLLPSHQNFRLYDPFDLKTNKRKSADLGKTADLGVKIEELRKTGLRIVKMSRINKYRQRALLTCQYKRSIDPDTEEYRNLAFLFEENKETWNRAVMVFENDDEEFMTMPVRTRFTDPKTAQITYMKGSKIVDTGFAVYKDAVFLTVTLPPIFPLVVPIEENKVRALVFLQESIIKELLKRLKQWVRDKWKGHKIAFSVHNEYHNDYRLHLHIYIYGIPYIIDWKENRGRNKVDPFTYYVEKYKIPLTPRREKRLREGKLTIHDKTLLSKFILTGYLDKVLVEDILPKFESALKIDLVNTYLRYKKNAGIQGPINDVRSVRNNRWVGSPPRDAIREYSSGATYRKVTSPKDYVLKYVLKMVYAIAQGTPVDPKESAKTYGYWLFGKRYYSYSPSLLPKEKDEKKVPIWHYVGTFNKLEVPDYVLDNLIVDYTRE